VSIIISRYTDHMKFAACIDVSFITFFHIVFGSIFYHCKYTMVYFVFFCLILLIILLLLCLYIFIFMYCLCVNVYLLMPPGVNPIAVNKIYHISYRIISYINLK